MKVLLGIAALALSARIALSQGPRAIQEHNPTQWQDIDQLCGMLVFATPIKKTVTTADGKTESRLYANVLKEAMVALYQGDASDEDCCRGKVLAGQTKSNKFGKFELIRFGSGWYWLQIKSDHFSATIPLHVTANFDDKACHDPSVLRVLTVDLQPPKVETRIR
jgi:hypothetical protein